MKRTIAILVLLVVILLPWWLLRERHATPVTIPSARGCIGRAEQMVATWKTEGKDATTIEKLFQAETAKCSGVTEACAAMIGTANADLAWLGRGLLSGSIAPTDYLARVHDRTRKLRESRKTPSYCAAFARGDADGDLVPDDQDRCPNTPTLAPTNPSGCPDSSPPLPAPSSEAVQMVVKALNIPLSKACMDAPLPDRATVLKAGLAPDRQTFLFVVTRVENQPVGCQIFYEVDIRIRNVSFFNQLNVTTVYHKVFRASDSMTGPLAHPAGMTFQLAKTAAKVPWNYLTFQPVEPGEVSERHFRVRTVNGNGFTQGWGAFTLVPMTAFP